ncbi:hypothetical protein CTEN210_04422 [Chaetoceros tenuissimus]|uniref:tRNA (guanine(37)-N1)-methyltransferase n=1 Tax=Chaetoceros tenuissimus TaxID=426638 RepID=A0AAD3CN18_9STRA|nr:hypothetical protein CTEN210_04422 [Chaetoceros tenuissimus]
MSDTDTDDSKFIVNESNWREHPSLKEILYIPSILVPSEYLHSLISQGKEKGILIPYLATSMEELENIHPKIKVVQNLDKIGVDINQDEQGQSMKAILLNPNTVGKSSSDNQQDSLEAQFPLLSKEIIESLASKEATPGPMVPITLTYKQQPIQHILSKLLPEEAQPPPTGFEQIGHVVHLNLKAHHKPYKKLIGDVILDRLSPKIQTVVNKIGEVSGPYRTYAMDILAGKDDTVVKLSEDNISLEFDLSKVYWCTRLSGERKRLLEEFQEGDIVADAFCGAGAFVVQAAIKRGCTVYANDLNPDAVKYCKENAKKNLKRYFSGTNEDGEEIQPPKVKVTCGDAFDFIQNLGMMEKLPNHVVMNFPLDSASFLGALRWWPVMENNDRDPIVHLYTFARGDNANESVSDDRPPRDAVEVAVDLVAEGLVPEGGAIEASKYRREFLDKMGCDVQAREVRDVAPGKVVICVSFKVSATLLRIMQGDFIDI